MFPKFTIEDGFTDDDPYWGKRESSDDVETRAKGILGSIFDTDNADKNCKRFLIVCQTDAAILIIFGSFLVVSITTHGHGGLSYAIFKIVGFLDLDYIHHGGVYQIMQLPSKDIYSSLPFIH